MCPNNSLSIRLAGIAPQFTAIKGLSDRLLSSCKERATNSFPEPVSPRTSTEMPGCKATENRQGGFQTSLCLVGQLAVKSDGLDDLGDGVGVIEVHGWGSPFPPSMIQALRTPGLM